MEDALDKSRQRTPDLAPIAYEAFTGYVRFLQTRLKEERWEPDFLVGIGRGGLVPGAYLSHATGIRLLSIDHSSGVPGFAGQLIEQLAAKTRNGQRLLVVDDINDSGSTIVGLRRALAEADAIIDNVRFAVLITNVSSAADVEYWATEIDRSTDERWFVFPWESMASQSATKEDVQAYSERREPKD